MADTALQMAKREWHEFFGHRPLWLGTLAAGLLLGLAGPFGTWELMILPLRLAYWVVVAVLTFLTGSVVSACILAPRPTQPWAAIALAAFLSSVVITLELTALNAFLFRRVPAATELSTLAWNVLLATAIILVTRKLLTNSVTDNANVPETPPLLARLPMPKRGRLISMSAVDHYVEVTTNAGTELILMRLSDAIIETHPEAGVQIHRSHWVATAQVKDTNKVNGKGQVVLSDGRALPVSRANWPKLKDVGLLQRTSNG